MMKKIFKLSLLSIALLILTSCATHTGYLSNTTSLSQANFSYVVKSISGDSRTISILGFGGLAETGLVVDAKREMLEKYPLEANQALANVTVDWRKSNFLIWKTVVCTVTADIVEFE